MTTFLLALCPPGAERALKSEAAARGLSSSFQRPGLVTFKAKVDVDVDALPAFVLAHYVGASFGKIDGDVVERLRSVDVDRLHVVDTAEDQANARALREQVLAKIPERFRPSVEPKEKERVATVILVDGVPWLAIHRHRAGLSPFPGGRADIPLPADAPSRAWLKVEEAARIFALPLEKGQRALELGSAPGGAAWALLSRGLDVLGVDPNDMDPRVLRHPRFSHKKTTSMSVDPLSLAPLDWIFLDVNVPPRTALRGALPFVEAHARSLSGIVFTLKMKSWDLAGELDDWLARIHGAAPLRLEARHLFNNAQELCVVGRIAALSPD